MPSVSGWAFATRDHHRQRDTDLQEVSMPSVLGFCEVTAEMAIQIIFEFLCPGHRARVCDEIFEMALTLVKFLCPRYRAGSTMDLSSCRNGYRRP